MISNFLPSAGPSVEVYNRGMKATEINAKPEYLTTNNLRGNLGIYKASLD
jgi:hypothetical protein